MYNRYFDIIIDWLKVSVAQNYDYGYFYFNIYVFASVIDIY